MDLGLEDRVALVTGGTSGIGEAIARGFAAEGARVALTYRASRARATELVHELGGPERVHAVHYDLAERASVEALIPAVEERFGRVDVLVANAVSRSANSGGHGFEHLDPAEWEGFLNDNLIATIRTVQTAVAGMRERGHGRIALISSHLAAKGRAGQEVYTAAKAALQGFALSLSRDVGPDGVLVNVVSPGLTATKDALRYLSPEVLQAAASEVPTGRLGTPEEVARATLFYCSSANENISGGLVSMSGPQ